MWRFLVADDKHVDYFIVRDADSRLSIRDSTAVKDWLNTGAAFHCMRDHPSHAHHSINGGLWGGRPALLTDLLKVSMADLMNGFGQEYVMDMSFLSNSVWPRVKGAAYCHDSVSCDIWPNTHPFPLGRVEAEHVGQV